MIVSMKMRILITTLFAAVVGSAYPASFEIFPTSTGGALFLTGSSSGPVTVEDQNGGPNGNYTIVFRFAVPLNSVGSVGVISGSGKVISSTIDSSDSRNYIVNLTGVTNAQLITLSLSGVSTTAGISNITRTVGFLIGDANGDGVVNSVDVARTKAQSGTLLSASNFAEDINGDGTINSVDVAMVKARSGTGIPNFSGGGSGIAPRGVPDSGSTVLLLGAALSLTALCGRLVRHKA